MAQKNQRQTEPIPADLSTPPGRQEARPRDSASAALPWLRQEKVTVSEREAGYLHRLELMDRILPTAVRSTVLKAPGGFGKTTLLSECCRSLKKTGVLTAWLTLDIQDAPQVVAAYLAFAFQEAGLDVLSGLEEPFDDHSAVGNRIEILVGAITRYGAPCVLALDELERLSDPDALDLVNLLLNSGPQNLGLAIACREFPDAVDIGSSVLAGRVALFDADQLRFSPPERENRLDPVRFHRGPPRSTGSTGGSSDSTAGSSPQLDARTPLAVATCPRRLPARRRDHRHRTPIRTP